jgi:hypothetical protein
MIIIGVDFHPEFQQIALLNTTTGEVEEKRLAHPDEAEKYYRAFASAGETVRIGMEASGHARWFELLVAELQFELWIGDKAEIRARRGRKQKTDRQDAQHILKLMLKDDFPKIWVPNWENRDLRQLLWHRHRMVQARTRVMNQLQAVALNEGLQCNKKLWRERGRLQLESFPLAPWASRRRRDLLDLLDRLNPPIAELTQAIEREVENYPAAQRLRTHPGVGVLTSLAFVIGAHGIECLEAVFRLGATELLDIAHAMRGRLGPQRIQHARHNNRRTEKVWSLGDGPANQDTARAGAEAGQVGRRRVFLVHQIFSAGDEITPRVRLSGPFSGQVPILAVFPTATRTAIR